jgi:hypothetical protein
LYVVEAVPPIMALLMMAIDVADYGCTSITIIKRASNVIE